MTEAQTVKKTAKRKAPVKGPKAPAKAAKAPKKALEGGFAVIATGGKQYRVQAGQKVKIEKLQGDHKEGDTVVFKEVLMKDNGTDSLTLGAPFISGATVSATISKIARYKTIDVIKYKQKSRYFKKYGHRQPYFEVTIDSIV